MIDTLLRFREAARARGAARRFGVEGRDYCVLTLHRPDNVDQPEPLRRVLEAVARISERAPVVFPVHPRTLKRLGELGLDSVLPDDERVVRCGPLGYLDFVGLIGEAAVVLTDSGGVQEETTVLGIPCLTLRESTERPVTVTAGTNRVLGTDTELIVEEALTVLEGGARPGRIPELWDGCAGERIVEVLREALYGSVSAAAAGR
jgi:UDP-N-acetylglucosamine 2-epimerase (non-hydrolysing)